MKLFIADDEIDVREGLRYILDWTGLSLVFRSAEKAKTA